MTRRTSTVSWQCPAGEVVGVQDGDVLRARGIRYAQAGRFEVPRPVAPSTEPIDATRPAPACPQIRVPNMERLLGHLAVDPPKSEDCLRLSVTTPADMARGERLPVMVWIHGGAYIIGAGDSPIYQTRQLVTEQRVVVVTVTYRLGVLGYLGDGRTRPANLGLLDQIEALRWVRTNISAFGGDPENVTIFGQSAGGNAVVHLMIAEGTEGLFRRVISQSPPIGVAPDRERIAGTMMEVTSDLTPSTPISTVLARQSEAMRRAGRYLLRGGMHFDVQYGYPPLPATHEVEEAWTEAAERLDLLIGSTDREAALFVPARLPKRLLRLIMRFVVPHLSDRYFGRGARAFARRHHEGGGHGYLYLLSWGVPGHDLRGAHAIELPLLFGSPDMWRGVELLRGMDEGDLERRGRQLRDIWGTFARTGDLDHVHEPSFLVLVGLSGSYPR